MKKKILVSTFALMVASSLLLSACAFNKMIPDEEVTFADIVLDDDETYSDYDDSEETEASGEISGITESDEMTDEKECETTDELIEDSDKETTNESTKETFKNEDVTTSASKGEKETKPTEVETQKPTEKPTQKPTEPITQQSKPAEKETEAPTESPKPTESEEENLAKEILNSIITPNMTEFEKAIAIHDWMTFNIDYDYMNYLLDTIPSTSYTVAGVLKTRYAICDGYAKTFRLLAELAGLEVIYVRGTADNGSGDGYQGHAWNQVRIEDKWYNVDVTWDDPTWAGKKPQEHDANFYDYFLISDDVMDIDHRASSDKNKCSRTYDRKTIYQYAIKSGLHGNNVTYAETEAEVVDWINKMGKADVINFEIWYKATDETTGSSVFDLCRKSNYFGKSLTYSMKRDVCRADLELYMTEKDICNLPIVTTEEEFDALCDKEFSSGAKYFVFINKRQDDDNVIWGDRNFYTYKYNIDYDHGSYYDKEGKGLLFNDNYSVDTIYYEGLNSMYNEKLAALTEKDYYALPVVHNDKEFSELCNKMFDSGCESFLFIHKIEDGVSSYTGKYKVDYDFLGITDYGDDMVYEAVCIGTDPNLSV